MTVKLFNYFVVHTVDGDEDWWWVARAPIGFDGLSDRARGWTGWSWSKGKRAKRYRSHWGANMAMHRLARLDREA